MWSLLQSAAAAPGKLLTGRGRNLDLKSDFQRGKVKERMRGLVGEFHRAVTEYANGGSLA